MSGIEELVSEGEGRTAREAPRSHDGRPDRPPDVLDDRLLRVTAAIADAVTTEQVYEAIVDRVGAALGATSAGLWLVREGSATAWLCRSYGYTEAARRNMEALSLDSPQSLPAADAILRREPVWISSQEELLRAYPQLASMVTAGRRYRIACLPITAQAQRGVMGTLAFTFDPAGMGDEDSQRFLLLVARYAGQALERLMLLESEQGSRRQAEEAAARVSLLYTLARSVIAAERVEQVFDAALDALQIALGAERSAILVFDDRGVMRFRAWRGLSEAYRGAVEGHSPWARDARDPQPVIVANAEDDPALAAFHPLLSAEGIGALAFVPLVAHGRLLGKFMVYFARPRVLLARELELARAIADHVAAALARFSATAELQATVRFNEMFTGILGHDLRNPLAAIVMAARLALMQVEDGVLVKPLSRILKSGDRMARMIDQLLDFTRVRTGGGIPLHLRALDLGPLLAQVIDELENAHPGRTVLRQERGDAAGAFDDDRLGQVFSNLIANAIQHGAPEHPVQVTLDGSAAETVTVEVHNHGMIPGELLPRLFEPMVAKGRRLDRARGLGLGLYITSEIVRAHGGSITVTSDAASGTCISVRLPRGWQGAGDSPAPATNTAGSGPVRERP